MSLLEKDVYERRTVLSARPDYLMSQLWMSAA